MDAHAEQHRRKIFAGFAMIAAPLLLGAAYVIGPATKSDATEQIEELVAAGGRVEIGMIFYLSALVLFVFVVMALAHLLREERPWMAQIGGVLAVTGLLLTGVINGSYLTLSEAAQLDVTTAVTLMEAVESNPVSIVAFAGILAFIVGVLILATGLLLARTAPAWSGALLAIGVLVEAIGTFAALDVVALAGIGAMFLALAPLGYELIVEPDEAWEHPAHFEGFRPVTAGAH